jgi:DNA-binding transcriptional ArsR family regulator
VERSDGTGRPLDASGERDLSGEQLLNVLAALANPHRLRIIAALNEGRNYVSELARVLGMSRPLLHMHLQRLEAVGLVTGSLELSDDGKAMRFYDVAPFLLRLDPARVAEAAKTLDDPQDSTGKEKA